MLHDKELKSSEYADEGDIANFFDRLANRSNP